MKDHLYTRRDLVRIIGVGLGGAAVFGLAGCTGSAISKNSGSSGNSGQTTTGGTSAGSGTAGPIKLGVLSSLTGLEGILGETMVNGAKLAASDVNAAGGINGRMLELIVEDDTTDPKVGVEKARKLVKQDGVTAIVGTITSAMRNAVASVTSEMKTLLIYPVYYEGGHCDPYLFVTGQVPNQAVDALVPWLMENRGKTFYIAGSDYVWPRETTKLIKQVVEQNGGQVVGEEFFPFGTVDFSSLLNRVKSSGANVMYELFAGGDAVAFVKQFYDFGLGNSVQMASNGLDESFTLALDPKTIKGTIACQSYFMSLDTPENKELLQRYHQQFGQDAVFTAIAESMYIAVRMYANAAAAAASTDTDAVIEKLKGEKFTAPEGEVSIVPGNHHARLRSLIGELQEDGQFKIVKDFGTIDPDVPGCNL